MIRAWVSLIHAIYLIKTRSLEQLEPLLNKRKSKCKDIWAIHEAEQAFYQIEKAKKFFFIRTACLEQSLALYLLATSKGKSVDWCVGVRLAPFASHAWIEIKGVPFKESETVEVYEKILTI
ncbi:lasso peptide biosynthesis B2 protein [Thermoflavimicrobium daqui]|jgi:ATP-binding cassette subfamily B protein|uniref:Lasso peptide biosynthesis B2 protein n=1 Tax=Thermoflavimicrobium daqui TaxID=2137476 RepID=A0A364K5Y7_9BACL|nr:lasso peptide biosynthesis B2 protein [Thermoflavimicrobium daqui]RAL25714.1 lasso peptide biosynthesis B2 protein [Thermoflavimicrobium daqui]